MRGSFARRQVGNGKVGGRGVGGEGHDGGRPHLRREVSRKQAQPFDKLHSITNAWQYVSQVSTFYARAYTVSGLGAIAKCPFISCPS